MLALSSLFTTSDVDGDPITRYQLWDGTADPNGGHFVINGAAQADRAIIDITAAQLAQTSFVVGGTADSLQIRAFDGRDWSAADNAAWSPFVVTPPLNHAPVVVGITQVLQRNWAVGLTSTLIAASDPDNDTITKYQLWDGTRDPNSGYFMVGGVKQDAGTVIEITAAQAAATTFVPGATADRLEVRAFDGRAWSAPDAGPWSALTIVPAANTPTTVFPHNRSGRKGDMFQLSTLISTSDSDLDPVVKYQLWDSTRDPGSGYFIVNGVTQAAGTVIEITAAQAAQTFFKLGTASESLQIRVFDGFDWSAPDTSGWALVTMTVQPNHAPVLTTSDKIAVAGQTLALSDLFAVSDADGDSIAAYQLWDSTRDPNSGFFVVDGVTQPAGTVIFVKAEQLSQTSFVAGTLGDGLQIRAMDSRGDWSAAESAVWSPFSVSLRTNVAPVLTTVDRNTTPGQSLSLSSLFNVTDSDGDAMTRYQLWDSTRDAASGSFYINGVKQAAGTVIDVTAAQLAQTSFLTGTVGDYLQIRAFDGFAWSAADNAAWAPFHISLV